MDFCCQVSLKLIADFLKKNNKTQNLVVSPLSFNVILNLICAGASGDTLEKMLRVLGCKEVTDVNSNSMKMMGFTTTSSSGRRRSGPSIRCLNGIWFDQKYGLLKSSFHDLAQKIYNAKIQSSDFLNKADKVVDEANAWAKKSTKGLITKVLEHGDLDDATVLLGNALYFKGFWEHAFLSELTSDRTFCLMNKKRKKVPFMKRIMLPSRSLDNYDVVSIPYKTEENGNMFSMYIILPKGIFGLQKLLEDVASDSGFLRQDFSLEKWGVFDDYYIPKFKFTYHTSKVMEIMHDMELTLPFSCKGGLQEMVKEEKIKISKIVHKSFIEVDEKGTEATAVNFAYKTYSCRRRISKPPPPREFIADHSFLFMIREENTKFVLFSGIVLDPTAEE